MLKRVFIIMLSILMFSVLLPAATFADNAEVYPKGVTALRARGKIYFPVDERYNDSGDTEDVAEDFNA